MLTAIYAGNAPNRDLFKQTAAQLIDSIYGGYGKELRKVAYNSPDFVKLNELTYNAGVFSAFKNHSQINETVKLLKDADGNVRSKKDFIAEARKLDDTYNRRYLSAEYNHATTSAQMARKWQDVERTKDIYPNLTYIAVNDDRTRRVHKEWSGITLPIDHPFWEDHYPPNDWGCRCSIRRSDKPADDKGLNVEDMPKLPKQFNINVGKAGKVFDDSHPYFQIPEYKKVAKAANASLLDYQRAQLLPLLKKVKGIAKTSFVNARITEESMVKALQAAHAREFVKNNLLIDLKRAFNEAHYLKSEVVNGTEFHYMQVDGFEDMIVVLKEVDDTFYFDKIVDQVN